MSWGGATVIKETLDLDALIAEEILNLKVVELIPLPYYIGDPAADGFNLIVNAMISKDYHFRIYGYDTTHRQRSSDPMDLETVPLHREFEAEFVKRGEGPGFNPRMIGTDESPNMAIVKAAFKALGVDYKFNEEGQ